MALRIACDLAFEADTIRDLLFHRQVRLAVTEAPIRSLPLLHSGKVRDLYRLPDQQILMVASDRLSAFDVILPDAIPHKGRILTALSVHWFEATRDLIDNHLTGIPVDQVLSSDHERQYAAGRALVVRGLRPLPLEAVVRGYLAGSGWKDYQASGSICGISLPPGLRHAEALPEPLFTPSSKAAVGAHDEPMSYTELEALIGAHRAAEVRQVSLAIYQRAASHASACGLILADTKFEFGLDEQDRLVLMDELLTPDSSRWWDAASWSVGSNPASFDKQYVRDYLEQIAWDKRPPGPQLPAEVIAGTVERYREAYRRICQRAWPQ